MGTKLKIAVRLILASNMVLSIKERIFLVEYIFCPNGKYTDKVKTGFLEKLFLQYAE